MSDAYSKKIFKPQQQAEILCVLLGRAVWAIQHLEDALSHSMALKNPMTTSKNLGDELLKENRGLTLGKAIRQAQEDKVYDDKLQESLSLFLVDRNWLVHKCMRESVDEKGLILDCKVLFERIQKIEFSAISLKEAVEIDMLEFVSSKGRGDIREVVRQSYLEHLKNYESR